MRDRTPTIHCDRTPTIHCDAEDGDCGAWDMDYYEACASSVDGVPIGPSRRAPGWVNSDDADLCPEHAKAAEHG